MAGGDQVFGNHTGAENLRAVFDAATDCELNLWDTATVYGMGASEDILGTFIKDSGKGVEVSTKFTPQIAGDGEDPVADMCNASLRRLNVDRIDLYWIHNPADVERWTPYLAPLVKSGKVVRVGVSNHNLAQIKRAEEILSAEGVHISAVQNHFSLLYRSSEDAGILDYCRENGIEFYSYMVLEQGALTGVYGTSNPMPAGSQRGETYNPILPQMEELISRMRGIAENHGAKVPQVAIAWAIAKGTIPIVGVTKPHHVTDAAGAKDIVLSDAEMDDLERLSRAASVDTRGSWENPMA